MFATYLDETYTIPYPFKADQSLPFPNYCIVGLSICIKEETADTRPYVSSITISDSKVRVVVCLDNAVLGTFTVLYSNENKTANLVCTSTMYVATGFIVLGRVTKESFGSYNGHFNLDPSCISFLPASVYGFHTGLYIDNTEYKLSNVLKIAAAGLLQLTSTNELRGTKDSGAAALLATDNTDTYTHVTAINNVDCTAASLSDKSITLAVSSDETITLAVDIDETLPEVYDEDNTTRLLPGNTVRLIVRGGHAFPNCYTKTDDQADTLVFNEDLYTVTQVSI